MVAAIGARVPARRAPNPMVTPETRARRMTLAQWTALDEDVEGELVDGVLEEEEMPSIPHELVVSFLIEVLRAWFVPRGGFVLGSETKLGITAHRGRKPDVVVYASKDRLPPRRAAILRAAPDIVVEVVTPTPRDARRDRVRKKPDYAKLGVRQYWLVDPEIRSVEILARSKVGRFVEVLAESDGAHKVPGMGGLTLDLDAMWAEIERWPDEG